MRRGYFYRHPTATTEYQLNLAVRERQFDLTRMLLEYPEAAASLLGSSISTGSALLNLHIAQAWLVFDTGAQDAASMTAELSLAFQTDDARRWWTDGGGNHWRALHGRHSDTFARIVDDAVELARFYYVASAEERVAPAPPERSCLAGASAVRIAAGAGLLAGVGVLWLAGMKRRQPHQ